MPTSAEDYAQIEQARKKQAQATKDYGSLTSSAQTFGDEVMAKVREARASRGVSKMATQMGETSGQLASEGPKIRERLADVNPLQTDVITGKQTAQTLSSLGTLAQVGQEREGTITDILGAGTNQILARAAQKKAEAEAASMEADSLIETYKLKQAEEAQAFDQWYKRASLSQKEKTGLEGVDVTKLSKDDLATLVANGTLTPTQATFIGKQSGVVEEKAVRDVITQLTSLKDKLKTTSWKPSSLVAFENTKKMAGQMLARLVETGRLSDADREFYQSLLPNVLTSKLYPDYAESQLTTIITDLSNRLNNNGEDDFTPD